MYLPLRNMIVVPAKEVSRSLDRGSAQRREKPDTIRAIIIGDVLDVGASMESSAETLSE